MSLSYVGYAGRPRSLKIARPRYGSVIETLRRIRIEKGISQKALCKQIGAGENRVSTWESGRDMPGMFLLQAWANTLGKKLALEDL